MIINFFKPQNVDESIKLKNKHPGSVFIAGGTEVNSSPVYSNVSTVISIENLSLNFVKKTDTEILIGAGVTFQEILDSPDIPGIIKTAAKHITNRNIRNIATIGGNIGANKSCSNILPVLIVLNAKLETEGETLNIEKLETLGQALIKTIIIPVNSLKKRCIVNHYSRTANDISLITTAISGDINEDKISNLIIAVGGVSKHVIRLRELENMMNGKEPLSRQEILGNVKNIIKPVSDIRGSSDFKKHLAANMVCESIYEILN